MKLTEADRRLALLARTAGHTPARDRAVARFSKLGEHGLVWLAIGGATAVAWPARRERLTRASGLVVCSYVLNTVLKAVVRRRRPDIGPLVDTPTQLSFPSAHATTSVAAATLFARAGLPGMPLAALAASLAASRLYLGVHYPSDVIGGAVLGRAFAQATT